MFEKLKVIHSRVVTRVEDYAAYLIVLALVLSLIGIAT